MHSQHACCACICHATITSLNAQCFFFKIHFQIQTREIYHCYYSKVQCCQLVSACITSIKHFFPARSTNSKQQPPTVKPDISTEVFNSDENHWYKTEAVMGPIHGIQKLINTWTEYLWYECKRKLFLTFLMPLLLLHSLQVLPRHSYKAQGHQFHLFVHPPFKSAWLHASHNPNHMKEVNMASLPQNSKQELH